MARLFAAIRLPAEVEGHLDEHIDAVRDAHPELRWVAPQRWHLTLEFLGECGPHEVERQLQRWERRARRSAPMLLRLGGVGTFPKPWMARVLWVGLAGDIDTWRGLAGYQQEPHVTLARTRARQDLTGLVDELGRYGGPAWTATEIALIESHQRGARDNGPRYVPIETFPLGQLGSVGL
jgi:RNA 2',3'-cyclic 3'-phosphodiesterase